MKAQIFRTLPTVAASVARGCQHSTAVSYSRNFSSARLLHKSCLFAVSPANAQLDNCAQRRKFTTTTPKFCEAERIPITFLDSRGGKEGTKVNAKVGATLLEVAREHDIELEGACEGTLACSTCHCVFEKEVFDKLPAVTDEELDMLDLAAALTDTSRLGCQIKVGEVLRGAKIRIPDEFNNLYGSGGGSA